MLLLLGFQRTCLIIAPIDLYLGDVIQFFSKNGVRSYSFDHFDSSLNPTDYTDELKQVDFVCVISPGLPTPNVWFGVGAAVALRKPLFVVANQDFVATAKMRSASFVGITDWNSEVVEPHLQAFLSTLSSKRVGKPKRKDSLTAHIDFKKERAELQAAAFQEERLESFVEHLFRKAGLSVTPAPFSDFGADMAVWSPGIKQHLGGPILVEVKRSSVLVDQQWGLQKLSELVGAGRGSAGIYLSASISKARANFGNTLEFKAGPILILTPLELVDLLENDRLVDSLRDQKRQYQGRGI